MNKHDEVKPFTFKSSLTDTAIFEIYQGEEQPFDGLRAIADAAANQAIQDLKAPSVEAIFEFTNHITEARFIKKILEPYLERIKAGNYE